MSYRYLIVRQHGKDTATERMSDQLYGLGLHPHDIGSGYVLFVSTTAPTLRMSDGSIVIGDAFLNNGAPLTNEEPIAARLLPHEIRSFLLQRCWGDYLLVQAESTDTSCLSVLRDPSGGVPCIYRAEDGDVFITSDISLAGCVGLYQKQIDWYSIAQFLAYTYVKTDRTALTGVRELLPGCILRLHDQKPSFETAWSPWNFVLPANRHSSIHDAAEELHDVVVRTVQSLSNRDRSVLVELSGGLDSSIVAACLKDSESRIACATLVPTLPGADERVYARSVAHAIGVDLHAEQLTVEAARFDGPLPSEAVTPGIGPLQYAVDQLMTAVALREGTRAFYSGGGGDTVFNYVPGATPAADAFKEKGWRAGVNAIRDLSDLHQCTLWRASRLTLRKLVGHRPPPTADLRLLDRQLEVKPPRLHPWLEAIDKTLPGDFERVNGLVGTQLFREGLPRGTSMRFRLPLLSQPVMEVCLSIPTWMWITGGKNRAVARLAFSRDLPRNVLDRRSKGNFSQYNAAVYRQNKDAMRSFLMEGQLQANGMLDLDAISAFFKRPPLPRDRTFMRIIDLCRAENWVRQQS